MIHKTEIAKLIASLGEYYDKKLSPTQIAMYVDDLCELSSEDLATAIRIYRNDPKNSFFPLPGKLKALINPAPDPESEAALIAESIAGAIAKVGPYRSPKLCLVAHQIISMAGGWQSLCELITYDNLATYKAQWRMAAKGLLGRAQREHYLALPDSVQNKIDIGRILPEWPGVKNG